MTDTAAARPSATGETGQARLAEHLRAALSRVAQGGPPSARERHLARGKLLPRDRIRRLLDVGSPFLEVAPLAADGLYDDPTPAAGVITSPLSSVSAKWPCIPSLPSTRKPKRVAHLARHW